MESLALGDPADKILASYSFLLCVEVLLLDEPG